MKKSVIILFILALLLNCSNIFSQKSKQAKSGNSDLGTEFNYFEKQRLERKEKKVSNVKVYDLSWGVLNRIDRFDEEGYLTKREVYTLNLETNQPKLYSEFILTPFDKNANVKIIELTYDETLNSPKSLNYENSLKLFLELEIETTEEDVKYIFNDEGQLIQKKVFLGEEGNFELSRTENLYYDKNGILKSSFSKSGNSKYENQYYYNELGMLTMEKGAYENNEERSWGVSYEYEFFNQETGK